MESLTYTISVYGLYTRDYKLLTLSISQALEYYKPAS